MKNIQKYVYIIKMRILMQKLGKSNYTGECKAHPITQVPKVP